MLSMVVLLHNLQKFVALTVVEVLVVEVDLAKRVDGKDVISVK
jgi:hypothetical protein